MKIFVALSLVLVACTHVPSVSNHLDSPLSNSLPHRIIDAHAHFPGSTYSDWGPDVETNSEFVANGVVAAVIHAPKSAPIPRKRTVLGKTRVAVCGAALPKARLKDYEDAIRDDRIHCLKIYLGYIPVYATDPAYKGYYRLAERHGIPVVFHTGDTYDKMALIKYADPLQIDEIAVRHPKVKFVIAHLGNPWIQTAAEVVYKNDNVYADLSALVIGEIEKSSIESLDELVVKPVRWAWHFVENPKKLMFGSDWPLVRLSPYIKAIASAIPAEHRQAFFHDNAAAVFGFDKLSNWGQHPNAISRR